MVEQMQKNNLDSENFIFLVSYWMKFCKEPEFKSYNDKTCLLVTEILLATFCQKKKNWKRTMTPDSEGY